MTMPSTLPRRTIATRSGASRSNTGLKVRPTYMAAWFLMVMIFVQVPLGHSTNSHINVYHILLLLLPVIYAPSARYLKINPASVFIVVITATSLAAWPDYGGGVRSTLIIFIIVSYFMGMVFTRLLSTEDMQRIFVGILGCCVVFIILRDIAFAGKLGAIYARTEDASGVLYMSTGGRNIEASLLALLSILLIGRRAYLPAVFVALLTSATMLSRAGLIGVAISVLLAAWHARKSKHYYLYTFLGIAVVILLAGLVLSSIIDVPVLDRFNLHAETQLEQKNVGRLALWHTAGQALHQHWLGYGVGNGVPVMEQLSGLKFVENNVHNIYLQFFLEGGVQSIVLFLVLVGTILFKRTKGLQSNIKSFLLCYLLLATIQFSGYEVYFWFFVGMFFAMGDQHRNEARSEAQQVRRRRRQKLGRGLLPAPDTSIDAETTHA